MLFLICYDIRIKQRNSSAAMSTVVGKKRQNFEPVLTERSKRKRRLLCFRFFLKLTAQEGYI